MTEENQSAQMDENINDKDAEEMVSKSGGHLLLDLFRKIKKKIANFNIRVGEVEKTLVKLDSRVDETEFDITINSDALDDLEAKVLAIKEALDEYGCVVQFPVETIKDKAKIRNEIKEKKQEEIEDKTAYRTGDDYLHRSKEEMAKIWTSTECCCWTCIHSTPKYDSHICTQLRCDNTTGWNRATIVNPLSKCYLYAKTSLRNYPPPSNLCATSAMSYWTKDDIKDAKEMSSKRKFMGVNINTGKEKCWE